MILPVGKVGEAVAAPVRPHSRSPGQPAPRCGVVVGREQVGAPQLLELQAVFQQAQEPIGGREVRGVIAADIPARGQRGQRSHRRSDPQRPVRPAVDQLQQLHRELHVAQPTMAQLEFPFHQLRRNVVGDPAAHRLDLGHEIFPIGSGPHHRCDVLEIPGTELCVTGDRTSFEQCLELPGLGPPAVVGQVPVQGADQRTGFAFGA